VGKISEIFVGKPIRKIKKLLMSLIVLKINFMSINTLAAQTENVVAAQAGEKIRIDIRCCACPSSCYGLLSIIFMPWLDDELDVEIVNVFSLLLLVIYAFYFLPTYMYLSLVAGLPSKNKDLL